MIFEDLLISYGADYKKYRTNDIIFAEGENPSFYYQILDGKVKINNYNDQGKEFIQRILSVGEIIVVTALFIDRPYPMNAVVIEDCKLIRLPKQNFFNLLSQRPEFYTKFLKYISESMYYKHIMMQTLSFQKPENRLKTLMNYLKEKQEEQSPFSFQVPYTRQQLASLTGLSVETVIRVTKLMEKNDDLKIKNRKIFY